DVREDASLEPEPRGQWRPGPGARVRGERVRLGPGRSEDIDFGARRRDAEDIGVDAVLGRLGAHRMAALLEEFLLVGANVCVLGADVADRRDDLEVGKGADREVEAHLVVAHGGAPVSERAIALGTTELDALFDDDVAVRAEERILALVEGAAP